MTGQPRFHRLPLAAPALALLLLIPSLALSAGDPGTRFDDARLNAPEPPPGRNFGRAIALHGDPLLVGGYGAVHEFARQPTGTWAAVGALPLPADAAEDAGLSLALDGDRLLVGARGDRAYVFERQPDRTWLLAAELQTQPGFEAVEVALDGDHAALGDPNRDFTGAALVFERQPDGSWAQVAEMRPSDPFDYAQYGFAVALQDGEFAVGAYLHDNPAGSNAGSVFLYALQPDGTWAASGTLQASDAHQGGLFGTDIVFEGARLLVGSWRDGAYLFERQGDGTWAQAAWLPVSRGGRYVALDGDAALVGAPTLSQAGRAFLFERQPHGDWDRVLQLRPSDGGYASSFGWALAIDGATVFVGDPGNRALHGNGGAAYHFQLDTHGRPVAQFLKVPTVECTDLQGVVRIDGSVSFDPDRHPPTHAWTTTAGTFDSSTVDRPLLTLPLGTADVTLTVTDPDGLAHTTSATVRVVDTLPPRVTITRPVGGTSYVADQPVQLDTPLREPEQVVGALTVVAEVVEQCGIDHVAFTASHGASRSDGEEPFTFRSDPHPTESGEVTVTAVAVDVAGLTGSRWVRFDQVGTNPLG